MGNVGEPYDAPGAASWTPVDYRACVHEAAHAIVGMAFGRSVEAIRVKGKAGLVAFRDRPDPVDDDRARHYWGELCVDVAGDVGEILYEEVKDDGVWRTAAERLEWLKDDEATSRALCGSSVRFAAGAQLQHPAGELGLAFRYAVAVTGCVLPVTARMWLSMCTHGASESGCSHHQTDLGWALQHAARVLGTRETASPPYAGEWPAEGVDSDGLDPTFHLIRHAELKAERILKGEWNRVSAVAASLYRRKNHRMTGRQFDAVLRRLEPPSAPAGVKG